MKLIGMLVFISALAACGQVEGTEGPEGPAGPQGDMGAPGSSVNIATEPPGPNCETGGFALRSAQGVAYVCNGVAGADGIDATAPTGSVVAFAAHEAPPGWLLCNGAVLDRNTYAELFDVIGTEWGEGDGATTFNLPDMRGRFLRGVDRGAGRDPDASGRTPSARGASAGDHVGSLQSDAFRSHNHPYTAFGSDGVVVTGHLQGGTSTGFTVWSYGGTTGSTGAGETRPINVGVNYIIKY